MSTSGDDKSTAERTGDRGPSNVLFDAWLVSRSVHRLFDTDIESTGLEGDEFEVYSGLS